MRGIQPDKIIALCDGELRAWVEQEVIHIKALASHGDPVELTCEQAKCLAQALNKWANEIDD
jgi:hypothetical protein